MMKFNGWKTRKQTLNEVLAALQRMEQSLAEMKNEGVRGHVDITVENLKVDQANLERLVFHLDSLDIQDLSGALNLGNNFGVKVQKEKEQAESDPENSEGRGAFGSPLMRSKLLTEPPLQTRWKSETSMQPAATDPITGTKTGYKIDLQQDRPE